MEGGRVGGDFEGKSERLYLPSQRSQTLLDICQTVQCWKRDKQRLIKKNWPLNRAKGDRRQWHDYGISSTYSPEKTVGQAIS